MPCDTLTLELIYSILENEEKHSPILILPLKLLFSAMNDWRTELLSAEQYEMELRIFVGKEINKHTLEDKLTNLKIANHAWEAESISSILDLYENYNQETTLLQIIQDLKNQIVL